MIRILILLIGINYVYGNPLLQQFSPNFQSPNQFANLLQSNQFKDDLKNLAKSEFKLSDRFISQSENLFKGLMNTNDQTNYFQSNLNNLINTFQELPNEYKNQLELLFQSFVDANQQKKLEPFYQPQIQSQFNLPFESKQQLNLSPDQLVQYFSSQNFINDLNNINDQNLKNRIVGLVQGFMNAPNKQAFVAANRVEILQLYQQLPKQIKDRININSLFASLISPMNFMLP